MMGADHRARSKPPEDDMKEVLRTDDNTTAWQAWGMLHMTLFGSHADLGVSW